jgi:hypothetical protein
MTEPKTVAAPRNTEEQLVGLLHDAAIEYEGTRIQGLLCRAGDVLQSHFTDEWMIRAARRISTTETGARYTHAATEDPRVRYMRIAAIIREELYKANAEHEPRAVASRAPCSCSVPVPALQEWAVALSQGDNSPRWEIEKVLTDAGHEIRDRSI